jgi:hypothetical protein
MIFLPRFGPTTGHLPGWAFGERPVPAPRPITPVVPPPQIDLGDSRGSAAFSRRQALRNEGGMMAHVYGAATSREAADRALFARAGWEDEEDTPTIPRNPAAFGGDRWGTGHNTTTFGDDPRATGNSAAASQRGRGPGLASPAGREEGDGQRLGYRANYSQPTDVAWASTNNAQAVESYFDALMAEMFGA